MNSSTSGWSTSRTTILAARRVAPPDLIVPAEASAPRMNETGPLAVPPEDSSSLLDRIRDRLTPAPEPPLKIRPSSRYHSRIESMVSSTARMKQLCTRRLPGQVLAALGLDVVDLHRAELLDLGDLTSAPVRAADVGLHVQQGVAGPEEPGHGELAGRPGRSARQTRWSGGDVERVVGGGVQAQHFLDPVGLGRDDPGHAVRVVAPWCRPRRPRPAGRSGPGRRGC